FERVRSAIRRWRPFPKPLLKRLERVPCRCLLLGGETKVAILFEPARLGPVDLDAAPLRLDPQAVALGRMHPAAAQIELVALPIDRPRPAAKPVRSFDQ